MIDKTGIPTCRWVDLEMGAPSEFFERELARYSLIDHLNQIEQNQPYLQMLKALPRDIYMEKSNKDQLQRKKFRSRKLSTVDEAESKHEELKNDQAILKHQAQFPDSLAIDEAIDSVDRNRGKNNKLKYLWYPSAENDARPFLYFSNLINIYKNRLQAVHQNTLIGRSDLTFPDLYIFTCLTMDGAPYQISREDFYQDDFLSLEVSKRTAVINNRNKFPFQKGYTFLVKDPYKQGLPDGYLIELHAVDNAGTTLESFNLLYLFHENTHFFDEWIFGSKLFSERLEPFALVCT